MATASSKTSGDAADSHVAPEGSMFVPTGDLTCHNFGSRDDLTDRQYFAWAFQTETKIRFQKLEARNLASGQSATLASDYFIDVYPPRERNISNNNTLERDLFAFQRTANVSLREPRQPDGTLKPIEINGYDIDYNNLSSDPSKNCLPVPPNFLYFEICLEAYTGYNATGFHQIPHIQGVQ